MANKTTPRKLQRSRLDLATVDWTKRDTALAVEHGLTRERIRQIRKSLGLPSSRVIFRDAPVVQCKKALSEHQSDVSFYTAAKFRERFCPRVPVSTLVAAARAMSLKFVRHNTFPFDLLDWRLPNEDLAKVWGVKPQVLARRRPVAAKFDLRRDLLPEQNNERASLRAQSEATKAHYVQICGRLPHSQKHAGNLRPSAVPWGNVNWLLPNRTLSVIWRQKPAYISARRNQLGKGESFIGTLLNEDAHGFKAAVRDERDKAKKWHSKP